MKKPVQFSTIQPAIVSAIVLFLLCPAQSAFAGSIVAWEDNSYGQCNIPSPNSGFIAISAGGWHSLGLKQDGSILAWGYNYYRQCNIPSPNTGFIAIASGGFHSLGLRQDGSIVAWGDNGDGQCNIPSPNSGFIAIAAGGYHSLGLKQDGSIVAWGWNAYGQCNIPSPNSGFIAIAAGWVHSLGLKQDGSIVAWEDNSYGRCNIPSPNSGFITIAAGAWHSLGLKQDGSIVAWEDNSYGQCNIPSPNSGFITIAAGVFHSLGLKQDGSIVAWGDNRDGQCNIPSPNSGFIAIAAREWYSLALRAGGEVTLKRFEINQCFQEVEADGRTQKYELIETKPFVVRVNLERYFSGTTSAKVKLSISNAKSGQQVIPTREQNATITENSLKPLDFLFTDNETKDMKAGDYKFTLVVEDNKGTKFLNWSHTYTFKSSKTIRILVVPKVIYNYKIARWDGDYIRFVEKVLPVPKNQIEIEPVLALPVVSGVDPSVLTVEMLTIFTLCLMNTTVEEKPDFICAVVPEGTLSNDEAGWRVGPTIIIEESSSAPDLALGHEIGHIYGLGDEYVKTKDMPMDSNDPPWEINKSFRFDRNPPPLMLSENGDYIIKRFWNPYDDEKCEENPDKTAHPDFRWEYSTNKVGQEVCRRWSSGNYVKEGGYNVGAGKQIPNAEERLWYSMMSALVSPKVWISGPEYAWLIRELVENKGTTGTNLLDIRTSTSLQAQTRMIISGLINISLKTAELRPLIAAQNLELTPEATEPNCYLVFLSQTMFELGTFKFIPLENEGSSIEGPFFVVVDLPADTALIKVVIDGVTAAELRLTDNSPTVQVLSPNGGEQVGEQLDIAWSASDMDGDKLKYIIEFSNNNGAKWSPIAIDYNDNELVVDSNYLPGGPNCLIKVIASDGWNRSEDISDAPFSITTKPPKVNILEPADGSILLYSSNMQGRCTVYDPETGYITDPNKIIWSSSIDGFLGKGNLTGFRLSLGNHILSLTATDLEGKNGTDTSKVTVVANRADLNRDLHVDFSDWAKFANRWKETCSEPNWCEGIDLNRNGSIDFSDLAAFVENWLWRRNPGDINADGDVDFDDYSILASQWQKIPTFPFADISPDFGDGMVDIWDLAELAENWLWKAQP